jgi:hypothetical protein
MGQVTRCTGTVVDPPYCTVTMAELTRPNGGTVDTCCRGTSTSPPSQSITGPLVSTSLRQGRQNSSSCLTNRSLLFRIWMVLVLVLGYLTV